MEEEGPPGAGADPLLPGREAAALRALQRRLGVLPPPPGFGPREPSLGTYAALAPRLLRHLHQNQLDHEMSVVWACNTYFRDVLEELKAKYVDGYWQHGGLAWFRALYAMRVVKKKPGPRGERGRPFWSKLVMDPVSWCPGAVRGRGGGQAVMVDGGATLRRIAAGRGAGPRPMREGGEEEEALALEDLPDFAFHRIFAKVGHGGACALAICCRKLLARVLEEKVWEVSTAYCSRHRAERETDLDPQDLYVQRFGPDPPEPSPGSAPHGPLHRPPSDALEGEAERAERLQIDAEESTVREWTARPDSFLRRYAARHVYTRAKECPNCLTLGLQPIIYGMPGAALTGLHRNGVVKLFGDHILHDSAAWTCTTCKAEYLEHPSVPGAVAACFNDSDRHFHPPW